MKKIRIIYYTFSFLVTMILVFVIRDHSFLRDDMSVSYSLDYLYLKDIYFSEWYKYLNDRNNVESKYFTKYIHEESDLLTNKTRKIEYIDATGIDERLRKIALTKLLTALNYSEPKVIGVIGYVESEDTSIFNIFSHTKLVFSECFSDVYRKAEVYYSGLNCLIGRDGTTGELLVNSMLYKPVWYAWDSSAAFIDFGLTVSLADKGVLPQDISYDVFKDYVKISNKIIPTNAYGGASVINLNNISQSNKRFHPFINPMIDKENNDTIMETGFENILVHNSMVTNFSISNSASNLPKFDEFILDKNYKNKIVIINITHERKNYSLFAPYVYAIQNHLENKYIVPMNLSTYVWGLFILAIVYLGLYYRFSTLYVFLSSLAVTIIILMTSYFAYQNYSYLFNPFVMLLPIGIVSIFILPYETISERVNIVRVKHRLESELDSARSIQTKLLPVENPTIAGFDIYGKTIPAHEVGGDFYDYIWLDQEKTILGIAIADVSGKAMGAAMTAVMSSGIVYSESVNSSSPKQILKKVNHPLYIKTEKNIFTAIVFASLDIVSKKMKISNAGQVYPIMVRNKQIQYLKINGPRFPLGMIEQVHYQEEEIQLIQGDVVLFYTDGITEAMNSKQELFGFERLENVLKSIPISMSAQQIIENILSETKTFTGRTMQHDDMTMVLVKVG